MLLYWHSLPVPTSCFLSGKWDVLDDFPASIWRGSLQVFHHPAPANLRLRETPATKGDAHSLLCICSYQNKWAILNGKITYFFQSNLTLHMCTKMHMPWCFMYIAHDQNYESGILPSKPMLIIVSKERITKRPHVWAFFPYIILIILAGYKSFSHLLMHFHAEHLSQKLAFYKKTTKKIVLCFSPNCSSCQDSKVGSDTPGAYDSFTLSLRLDAGIKSVLLAHMDVHLLLIICNPGFENGNSHLKFLWWENKQTNRNSQAKKNVITRLKEPQCLSGTLMCLPLVCLLLGHL